MASGAGPRRAGHIGQYNLKHVLRRFGSVVLESTVWITTGPGRTVEQNLRR